AFERAVASGPMVSSHCRVATSGSNGSAAKAEPPEHSRTKAKTASAIGRISLPPKILLALSLNPNQMCCKHTRPEADTTGEGPYAPRHAGRRQHRTVTPGSHGFAVLRRLCSGGGVSLRRPHRHAERGAGHRGRPCDGPWRLQSARVRRTPVRAWAAS